MKRALVFDSGVGGLSVLDAMVDAGVAWSLDYVADNAWLPYGDKPEEALVARVPALIHAVAAEWAPDVVVIACNTASTIALEAVRARVDVPVVGVVPPIKPAAALTRTGVIGLLATPATVRRAYTDDLIARFAPRCHVVRVGSTALVAAAETKLSGAAAPADAIDAAIEDLFTAPRGDEIDVVALACTHFPLLRDELAAAAPRAVTWLDSGAAVARRAAEVAQAQQGVARLRRVGMTRPESFASLDAAFSMRGFTTCAAVGASAPFAVSPWPMCKPA